jgi:glutamine amidotransferase
MNTSGLPFPAGPFIPIGETDSEIVFCGLLSWLNENAIALTEESSFRQVHAKLLDINRFGELNLVFSDGKYLFAYHDLSGHVGLHFLQRKAPYQEVRLRGGYLTANLADLVDPRECGYLVASMPLSNERWQAVRRGQLLVIKEGELVFCET